MNYNNYINILLISTSDYSISHQVFNSMSMNLDTTCYIFGMNTLDTSPVVAVPGVNTLATIAVLVVYKHCWIITNIYNRCFRRWCLLLICYVIVISVHL